MTRSLCLLSCVLPLIVGCGVPAPSTTHEGTGGELTGVGAATGSGGSASSGMGGAGGASAATTGAGGGGTSAIEHVLIIVQENHTFDAYFGRWCTAKPGSNPSCTSGPSCCEAAPAVDPKGTTPVVLDDAENADYDPNHEQACELEEIDGGAMDGFASGPDCADARNVAISPDDVMAPYHALASQYALADRYFQPIVGQSSSNDMYFAVAREVFIDNQYKPDTNGQGCTLPAPTIQYEGVTTIADLLLKEGHSFAFYAEGYDAMKQASFCPGAPPDCPAGIPTSPCDYDPSDNPFQYYAQFADDPGTMKDYEELADVIAHGTLPSVAFVKGVGYHDEHPGYGTRISDGIAFATKIVDEVLASPLAGSTLVLLTWDEGGGFFDHVAPPPASEVDQQPYGTRVPLLAIGRFARKNAISHVTMEHSSIVKFLEWNFLGATGQLGARDAVVANIGSLLDPAEVGVAVPED